MRQRKVILVIIACDRKVFGVMMNEGNFPMKERYGAQWRNVRYRRLQTSRKCHWLDNMCLTELTLDKSTSISKIKRWKKVREGAVPGLSPEKEGKDLIIPVGREANCPEEEAHIVQRQMKNWKLMVLLRKRRKTDLLSQKKLRRDLKSAWFPIKRRKACARNGYIFHSSRKQQKKTVALWICGKVVSRVRVLCAWVQTDVTMHNEKSSKKEKMKVQKFSGGEKKFVEAFAKCKYLKMGLNVHVLKFTCFTATRSKSHLLIYVEEKKKGILLEWRDDTVCYHLEKKTFVKTMFTTEKDRNEVSVLQDTSWKS